MVGSLPRRHRADHRAVGLRDDVRLALHRQHAEGLIVLGLQLRARPAGMLERGAAHGADVHRKAIMFLHAAGGPRQGLFAAKVRQHPAQPPGPSAGGDAQPRGQGPQIVPTRAAPDPIPHAHQAEDTPPRQHFFTTAHGGLTRLEFITDALLGLGRPLVHGRMAQLAQILNQQFLHRIGRLEGTGGGVRQIENALHSRRHLRMLPESLDEVRFLGGEFRTAAGLFQPDFIGASG